MSESKRITLIGPDGLQSISLPWDYAVSILERTPEEVTNEVFGVPPECVPPTKNCTFLTQKGGPGGCFCWWQCGIWLAVTRCAP